MKTTDPVIQIEQEFNANPQQLWKAITDPQEMRHWFFENMPDFKPEVGFKTQFNVEAPSRDFMHLWEVVEVIPNKKLVCKWEYEGLEGQSLVTYTVTPHDDASSILTVTTDVKEDFDDDIPEFQRNSCIEGWTFFIKERLKAYLDR